MFHHLAINFDEAIRRTILIVKQVNTFEFDQIDERQEKAQTILDALKPSNKLSNAIPDFEEIRNYMELNDLFINGIYDYLGIKNISREDYKEYLMEFARPANEVWKGGDTIEVVNTLFDKTVYDGIIKAGFDLSNAKRVFEIVDQLLSDNEVETLQSIFKEFLHFDYENLYNHLYEELITEGRANLNSISDELLEDVKKLIHGLYYLISFVGKGNNGLYNPILKTVTDPKLISNFNKAAKMVKKSDNETIKLYGEFLAEAGTGRINLSRYLVPTPRPTPEVTPSPSPSPSPLPSPSPSPSPSPRPYEIPMPTIPPRPTIPPLPTPPPYPYIEPINYTELARKFRGNAKIVEKGGFRMVITEGIDDPSTRKKILLILDMLTDEIYTSEGNDAVNSFFTEIACKLLFVTSKYIKNANEPIRILNKTIDMDMKIVDYINELNVNETSGEDFVKYVQTIAEKLPKIVDVFHVMLTPFYDLMQPFISFWLNFSSELCKKDATLRSFLKEMTPYGVEFFEYLNEAEGKKVSELKKDSIDLSKTFEAFWKAVKFDIEECDFENYSDFRNYTEYKLQYKFKTLPSLLLKSLKGSMFENNEVIELIKDITKNNAKVSLEKLSLLVEKIGNQILKKNPFVNMKDLILPITLPLASAKHYPNELYSKIFKCDLIVLNGHINNFMSHMYDGKNIDVSEIVEIIVNIGASIRSTITASSKYEHDWAVIEGRAGNRLALVIGASVACAVIAISIIIAVVCCCKKRNKYNNLDGQELGSQSGTLFQTL